MNFFYVFTWLLSLERVFGGLFGSPGEAISLEIIER
jgi:hypothetical protein